MKKTSEISTLALIPCYNEESTIGSLVIKARRHVNKVLVVDDGSKDNTSQVAKEAGAIVLTHKKNFGKGKAIKTGFKYALEKKYDFIVTIDGDGQHNADEIPNVLNHLKNNSHDITVGYRQGKETEMPGWRKIGKRVLDYSTSIGNGGYVTDSQNGFRAFNQKAVKSLVNKMNGNSFNTESEQLIKAHELGLKVDQTPVSCKYKGLKNTSTKDPASHGFSVLKFIIGVVAIKRPLLFISVPGFLFVIAGLFFAIKTLQYYNQSHIFLVHYAILVSILLIIGALAMFMGLVLNVLPGIIQRARNESD